MARILSQEPLFDVNDIQGDVLVGLIKKVERLLFFEITDPDAFRSFLKTLQVTSMAECLGQKTTVAQRKDEGRDELIPTPGLNVAFTASGLRHLGALDESQATDPLFEAGMAASQSNLSDPPPRRWSILRPSTHLHGVFIVTGSTLACARWGEWLGHSTRRTWEGPALARWRARAFRLRRWRIAAGYPRADGVGRSPDAHPRRR